MAEKNERSEAIQRAMAAANNETNVFAKPNAFEKSLFESGYMVVTHWPWPDEGMAKVSVTFRRLVDGELRETSLGTTFSEQFASRGASIEIVGADLVKTLARDIGDEPAKAFSPSKGICLN